ncbi:hypothetical protein GJAV_G00138510 [Gymnothorax javanicus]|nr:hypothetical protein GJAV_G00138510 [Gymnothorax javanicus]
MSFYTEQTQKWILTTGSEKIKVIFMILFFFSSMAVDKALTLRNAQGGKVLTCTAQQIKFATSSRSSVLPVIGLNCCVPP